MAARPSVLSIDPCLVVEWIPAGPNGRVAVASDGSVYVGSLNNHGIQKFTSAGVFVSNWRSARQFTFPAGFTMGDGSVYDEDRLNHRIAMVFTFPTDVAVASDGSVYVADGFNRIRKFSIGQ